jgi:hypothetical protein
MLWFGIKVPSAPHAIIQMPAHGIGQTGYGTAETAAILAPILLIHRQIQAALMGLIDGQFVAAIYIGIPNSMMVAQVEFSVQSLPHLLMGNSAESLAVDGLSLVHLAGAILVPRIHLS